MMRDKKHNETGYGKELCCELPVPCFHAYGNGCFSLIVRILDDFEIICGSLNGRLDYTLLTD